MLKFPEKRTLLPIDVIQFTFPPNNEDIFGLNGSNAPVEELNAAI